MPQESPAAYSPTLGSPLRRVFHTVLAIAGWVLFCWWWWLVYRRVSRAEVEFTVLIISVSLVVIILVTAIWALHNLRLFQTRAPRKTPRPVTPDFSRDTVGREVRMSVPEACRTASVVRVKLEGGVKTYVPEGGTVKS